MALDINKINYNEICEKILNTFKTKPIEIWDYEAMNTDTFDFYYYWDETHLSYEGAKAFTTMIRKRLYETSE